MKISVDKLSIACQEYHSEKDQTIFFIHGNSSSSNAWDKQVRSDLLKNYRLVTLDLPAHGDSSDSENPERDYTLPGLGKIMASAVNQLIQNKPFVLAGVSLGTNILAEMLPYLPQPIGIILAGPCVIGADFPLGVIVKEGADVSAVFIDHPEIAHTTKYAKETSISKKPEDLEMFLENHQKVRAPFRSVLFESIQRGNHQDQVSALLKIKIPLLIIFGEDEMVVNTHYLDNAGLNCWQKTIFKIPGASHLVNIDEPEAFNQIVAEYLTDLFK